MKALDAARETLYQQSRSLSRSGSSSLEGDGAGDIVAENVPAETPTMAQQQADALALVAEPVLHRGIDPGNAGDRDQVVVHVDAPGLADTAAPGQSVLENGTHVPAETVRRLACDASRGWLGERLDVGWAIDVLHPLATG